MSEAPKKKSARKGEGKAKRSSETSSTSPARAAVDESGAPKERATQGSSSTKEKGAPKRETDKPVAASEGVPPQAPHREPPPDLLDDRQTMQLRIGAFAVWLVTAILAGALFGPPQVVLVLAAGVLGMVIWLFWSSLRTLLGETRLTGADAYAMGAIRAEEEQKRAVLRALKDLEFERSVGKISEDDYKRLAQEYRFEAKRLLRQLDEDSKTVRDRAQALVDRHLEKVGLGGPSVQSGLDADAPSDETAPSKDATASAESKEEAATKSETMHCPFCDVLMDRKPGALCPGCGALAGKKPSVERSSRKERLDAARGAEDASSSADGETSDTKESDTESEPDDASNEKASKEAGDV